MPTKTFPHYNVEVINRVATPTVRAEELPIHRPCLVAQAQQGPLNTPVWCSSAAVARQIFGSETFNNLNTVYYSAAARFAEEVFANTGGVFFTRVADGNAATAFAILELAVTARPDIPQYETDEVTGLRTLDGEGAWIPLEGYDAYAEGYQLYWHLRTALQDDEVLSAPNTYTEENEVEIDGAPVTLTTTFYPMFVLQATSPGIWGNDLASAFYFSLDSNDTGRVARTGSIFYTFAPIRQDYGLQTTTPAYDIYGRRSTSFSVKPAANDPAIPQDVELSRLIEQFYTGDNELPFTITTFPDNFETVGNLIMAAEDPTGAGGLTSAWLIDLMSGRYIDGRYYSKVEVLTTTPEGGTTVTPMRSTTNSFLASGLDGSLTRAAIETLVESFFELGANPLIVDTARYPFCHIYDTGYPTSVKHAMIDFTGIRSDVKATISTQDTNLPQNTADEDVAAGTALAAYASLVPESVVKNTGACRVYIYSQSGMPVSGKRELLPFTLWDIAARSRYQSGLSITGEATGSNGYNTMFDLDTVNWVPYNDVTKNSVWDNRINYSQYADMSRLHVPCIRTVFEQQNSPLVRAWYVDVVVAIKQAMQGVWVNFVDVSGEFDEIKSQVEDFARVAIDTRINGRYEFTVTMVRSSSEDNANHVGNLVCVLAGGAAFRELQVDIACVNNLPTEG